MPSSKREAAVSLRDCLLEFWLDEVRLEVMLEEVLLLFWWDDARRLAGLEELPLMGIDIEWLLVQEFRLITGHDMMCSCTLLLVV